MRYLVIETLENKICNVVACETKEEALEKAKAIAKENGYESDQTLPDADWWDQNEPSASVCVFDLNNNCYAMQN